MYKAIAIALAAIVVSLSAVACGTETVKSEPVAPAATQPAVFDGKAYAKKIEKAYVAQTRQPIKHMGDYTTWQPYYSGIEAESESRVNLTLAFDGGVSEDQRRDLAKRASLAFFNFIGGEFKKLDLIVVYDSTGLDIGSTFRRDVPLLNR